MPALTSRFQADGFELISQLIADEDLQSLVDAVSAISVSPGRAGIRHLLQRSHAINAFAHSSKLMNLLSPIMPQAQPVRAIWFDKTVDTNWYVTWHQDLTIAVKEKCNLDGWGPWSVKDEVVHVQPPANILEKMISLRIHVDDCGIKNGAIKFIVGSHAQGVLDADHISSARQSGQVFVCAAQKGDIIAMRPLILHASSLSATPLHRRVLHIEYAGCSLPAGLEWLC